GQILKGYVPQNRKGAPSSKSGVTIGIGVDLGSKTRESLTKDGVPSDLVQQLAEYTGFKGKEAANKLAQKPLTITEQQAALLSKVYMDKTSKSIEARYNAVVGEGAFREIPIYTRTAIISLAYQSGDNLAANSPKFWSAITQKKWAAAVNELNNYGKSSHRRRVSEGKLISLDLEFGFLN
ncbi:hypothetical protein GNF76_29175, partial [Pseudomonas sp. CCM 7893]